MSKFPTRQLPIGRPVSRPPIFHFLFSIFCLGLLCPSSAFALDPSLDISQYAHTSWKVRDGFVRGAIFAIAQTPDGYLWLGTESGLVRFDGARTAPWQPPDGEQLPSNFVQSLLVSRDGILWIGTHRGLVTWKDGKLTQYSEFAGLNVEALLEDSVGTVWIGASGDTAGKFCAVKSGKLSCYEPGGRGVNALYQDRKGNLWVAADARLWRWAPGAQEHYSLPEGASPAICLTEDDSGAILLSTQKGLERLARGKIESYALPGVSGHFIATKFLRSSDGSLWVGSYQGILHLHQGRTDVFKSTDGLSADFVTPIFEDREGSVWVGTQDGLDRFRDVAVPTISRKQGLASSSAWSVLATPDGSVWVVTAEGLNRWANGHVTLYRSAKALTQKNQKQERERGTSAATAEVPNSGLTGSPQSLGKNERGRLWASTSDGIFYFENGRFSRVPGVPGRFTSFIVSDSGGSVWISNFETGLLQVTPDLSVKRIPWSQFGHSASWALLPDRLHGGLWLGFPEGGVVYFKDGQVRASYSSANGLGKGNVSTMGFDSYGALWAATEGGLSRIKDGHIATITSKNGLPCDAVHWFIEDDDHAFWLYKPCGLVRIAPPEVEAWSSDPARVVQFTILGVSDGVRTPEIPSGYQPMATKSSDGRIWFLPRDGVSVLDPRHLPYNNLPPPVHIEQIIADGKTYDASKALKLPPLMRDLTIDYTALSLVVPEKVRFRVKLEGQDKDWREMANDRRVHYTNLASKHYRFLVKACNNSGVWNEEGAFVDFAILPAYYQTSWFRTLVVAAVVALLWAIYRIRVGVLERRQQLLERHRGEITALNDRLMKVLDEERTRIAGELHDGVLQKLTLLSLSLGAAKRQVSPDSEAKEKIGDVQKKLIEVGTDIRQLSHELHPVVLQESGLPEALSAYCQEFSKIHGIPVSCEADKTVRELSPGAALCIYRIAQEALGNVSKHSKANKVEVRLTRADARVCLSVSDDGVGFASNRRAESGGLGLINMRERVRQLRGTVELESEPGRGTTVRAEVPFRPAA